LSLLPTALLVILWTTAGWWCVALLYAVLNRLLMPKLPSADPEVSLPSLSVVIPARNEERDIGEAVASHCSQDYPGLEVLVVDDGSTDRTPEIIGALASRFLNLRILRCGEPPPGWMGKTNAQRVGLDEASGDLVLLADADVVYGPGTHRRAAAEMERRRLDLLAFLPWQRGETFGEILVVSFLDAFSTYCGPTFLVNVPALRSLAFGTGAGNLVRRASLDAIGGISAVGGEVVEDVALGQRLKRYRGRFRAVIAYGDIRLRMYRGFVEAVDGFTKNLYAALGRSPWKSTLGHLADLVVHVLPAVVLPFAIGAPALEPLRIPAVLCLGLGVLCNGGMALWARHPLWLAAAFPLRSLVWSWIALRSSLRYRRRGVEWRGRVYPPPRG
jgi:chlorobactene glucosyltransferase